MTRESKEGVVTGKEDARWRDLFARPDLEHRLGRHATSRAIAVELSTLRREAGLGVRELARAVGWDPAVVTRLEAGRGLIPTPATVARFAKACGAEVGYSFRRGCEDRLVAFGADVSEPPSPVEARGAAAEDGSVTSIPLQPHRRAAAKT